MRLWLEDLKLIRASSRRLLLENSPPPMFMLLSANWESPIPVLQKETKATKSGNPFTASFPPFASVDHSWSGGCRETIFASAPGVKTP
jgi:hypothetical protein